MVHDEQVFDAMDVFHREFKAWTVVPDPATQYNDQGKLRYKYATVHDIGRCDDMPLPGTTVNEAVSYTRMHLTYEAAKKYPMFRAIQAVMEHTLAKA